MNGRKNKVVSIINDLLSAESVPQGAGKTLEGLCNLYEFDRTRSYIRTPETMIFQELHDVKFGKEYHMNVIENEIDMGKSFYQKGNKIGNETADMLYKEGFIYTTEFESYQKGMESICYNPTEDKVITEAILYCISGNDDSTGVMGYFVLERYGDREKFSEDELYEIESICKVCNDKIENFERGKQLRDEELAKNIDEVTGLDMSSKFRSEVEELIRTDKKYAMLYLDIDKFKYINDMWSFETGTEILQAIAKVLKNFCWHGERCSRLESDKFALLLTYECEKSLRESIDKLDALIIAELKNRFSDIKITIICGIYIIDDKMSVSAIIDKANIARKSTKGSYKNVYVFYNQNLENYSEREKELEQRMMLALEKGEFVPFLQPKFDIKTNEISGAEALARWVASDRMISPAEFIPVFERNGFITQLDFVIYRQIFEFIHRVVEKGKIVPPISLNVSRDHMNNPEFLKQLLVSMDEYKIKHDMIELEITESVFVRDTTELQKFINDAREEGLKVSIDDFGTAYSSLNLLKDVIVDVVKMDKSFIDNIENETKVVDVKKDKVIVKNIINMINELEFSTIFEGLETKEQVEFMKEIGCKYGQGYVFARPMPLDEFEETYLK